MKRPELKPQSKGVLTLVDFLSRKRKEESADAIYSIMTALRGPDLTNDPEFERYKAVTILLRSYIGLDENQCNGISLRNWQNLSLKSKAGAAISTYGEFVREVEKQVYEILSRNTGLYPQHFASHLRYAIKAINGDELLRFAREFGRLNQLDDV